MTKLVIFAVIVVAVIVWLAWEMKRAIIEDDTETQHTEKQEKH